jgi:hypothetical protein
MGLEVTGGGGGDDDDGGSLLSAPGLAQKLEDEGTNAENANVLNLFLDSVSLPGGAPAPITKNVGSIDVTSTSIVFNGNFTRERYGRAAVQDPITLDSDKLSLLTDDNMTGVGKTKSICGALEFDNTVNVLNVGDPSDFAGLGEPSDINDFSNRPDSMYVNAGSIRADVRDIVMTAFRGDAESEFINAMVAQVGGDTAAFTTFNDVVSDQPLMQSIATDSVAIGMLSAHPNGSTSMAQSQTAMAEIADSQTAMQKLAESQTAMQAVAASQTAMQEVAVSQTAMEEVAASQTALQEVAGSQTAGNAVASSGTAVSVIETASSSADNSVPGPDNAPIYIAELRGGGGGGGDTFNGGSGGDGGDTTFHESTAEGGEGAIAGSDQTSPSGRGLANAPDVVISSTTGGGGDGKNNQKNGEGGDGGFVKALIMNPDRQSLSLTVGDGGSRGSRFVNPGGDGSATILTPNAF